MTDCMVPVWQSKLGFSSRKQNKLFINADDKRDSRSKLEGQSQDIIATSEPLSRRLLLASPSSSDVFFLPTRLPRSYLPGCCLGTFGGEWLLDYNDRRLSGRGKILRIGNIELITPLLALPPAEIRVPLRPRTKHQRDHQARHGHAHTQPGKDHVGGVLPPPPRVAALEMRCKWKSHATKIPA
ncbi:hypothetical protein MBM_02159 [Drepanopeziza brunnea f. sp. 'multigermtubi' MB_m1]|uniref:Uncharacterized protein n=1 Tax=Marssonina brunnea f. sp. multigermtubi (strain MB_m1) TaxID=1072389 RepID=K1X559_MARBU|nr:uncharacterized protein MBM_02159 [Drepanopeziza brunnea f. sp. 'multigermtubi' MB_m1]EKD20207.1 hypothetical protein MBM_02159 [Drepanopeziza brunnea f. sp. 'multigermtubi' MB_m1]